MSRYGSITVAVGPDAVHVTLRGEIDAGLAGDVDQALALGDPAGRWVEVDARQVTFMDCFGLRTLAWLAGRARGVVVLDPPRVLRFLLEVTDITGVVLVENDRTTAAPPATPARRRLHLA